MHRRASRLMEDGPQRSTTSSGARKSRKFTAERMVYQWKRITNLITTFLQFIQVKNFLIYKFPKETIDPSSSDSEYEKIPVPGEAPKKEKDKSQPWRVLNHNNVPYVVGPEMEPGQGAKDREKHTQDPLLCQHPSDKMLGRGGRGEKQWWYCQACGNRWKRIPLSKYEIPSAGTVSGGNDIICFGKHTGKTCATVYRLHPEYCQWILQTAETGDDPCQQLMKFAKYIASREAPNPENIPAGKMDEGL